MNTLKRIAQNVYSSLINRIAVFSRRRSMASLFKRGVSSLAEKGTVLFWVPGGMPLMLHLEGPIAVALRLRGYKVHAVICDGVFSACVKREITDQIDISKWKQSCRACKKACAETLHQFGVEHSYIGEYVTEQEWANANSLSRTLTWDKLEKLECRGINVGKNVKSAIIRYLKGHDLPRDQRLVQEYAFSGLVCATAAQTALDNLKPSRVFMSHGGYVDWGPALHTSLDRLIPVTAWMASYLPSRFYFRHIPDRVHIDFHNMSDTAWREVSAMPMTETQQRRLDSYLVDRYQRNASFDMQHLKPFTGKSSEALKHFGLDRHKPIWGVMAHINWDSVSDYAPMLYESFNEWMIDTIDIAKEVSDVQWLIKVHPAEAWDNPESGVEALVRKEFPELPGNIKLLSAEENISPLDFFGLVDGAVTVYGTAGLELAMQGKPVILAGDAHYGNKGFTHDAVSRLTYQNLLRHAGSIGPLRESQIDLAKKYAYCYFILRQIPVSVVANPNSKWWSFQFDQRERLLPGNDPVIDFICERLLDGKDFVMSPELEFKANTYLNEKR